MNIFQKGFAAAFVIMLLFSIPRQNETGRGGGQGGTGLTSGKAVEVCANEKTRGHGGSGNSEVDIRSGAGGGVGYSVNSVEKFCLAENQGGRHGGNG